MKSFIIDLCSFSVEAENADEAQAKAIRMLESGEEKPKIDAIFEDDYVEEKKDA